MLKKPLILMYHDIGEGLDKGRAAGAGLYDVSVESFGCQMRLLRDSGFRVVKLGETGADAAREVVLTFDDGEMNNFKFALPVLRDMGLPAYFFIIVTKVGNPGYMSWYELRELANSGMVVGSHAMSHRILTALPLADVERELVDSKRILEDNLGAPIENLSIPRGFYNREILDIARRVGYKNIFVSDVVPGTAKECYGRVAVMKSWSLSRFELALSGQVPLNERIFSLMKTIGKTLFGSDGYDRLRAGILGLVGMK